MSAEARQHPRARAKILVEFHHGSTTGLGQTNDVSEGGMFLETDTLAPVGTRVYLRLRIPGEDGETTSSMIGVVRRVEPEGRDGGPRGMGIRFEVAYAKARLSLGGFVGEALTDPDAAQVRLSALPPAPGSEEPAPSSEALPPGGGTGAWWWALGIAMVLAAALRVLL